MDDAKAAVAAESLIPDPRVVHYWDAESNLGTLYGEMLPLPFGKTLAWDIYFVYAPGVEWGEQPPMPTEWMHQLSEGPRMLDGEKLRNSVAELLPNKEPAKAASAS
jgi:hypothetical protein